MELTQSLLKELLHYDPLSGDFTWLWRDRRNCPTDQAWRMFNSTHPGKKAGCITPDGYSQIGVFQRRYRSHRLAFLYMTGSMPEEVDHVGGVRIDNRWENLRPVNRVENMRNVKRRTNNTSGVSGVSWAKVPKKWLSRAMVDDHRIFLGHFDDWFDAVCAKKSANNQYGFHPNHGR